VPVVVVHPADGGSGGTGGADAVGSPEPAHHGDVDDRPVVVGVDGSPASAEALRWAARAAVERKSALHVVHAWHVDAPVYPGLYPNVGPELAEQAQRTLDETVDALLAEYGGALPVTLVKETVADGAARALLQAAADAQLLVVGSRGRGGFAELLLGSVSQHVAALERAGEEELKEKWP